MVRMVAIVISLLCSLVLIGEQPEEECLCPCIIALYGPRGSGRAILAMRLREKFSFPNLSIASLVTNHLIEESPIGRNARDYDTSANDFPEDFPLKILCERLLLPDCSQGILLEDFPKTVEQAKILASKLSTKFRFLAIIIQPDNEWLAQRVQNRLVCRMCGKVYDDVDSKKNTCDICSGLLQRRPDDSPDVVKARVQTYQETTQPVLSYFNDTYELFTIPGNRSLNEIYQEIYCIIEKETKNRTKKK